MAIAFACESCGHRFEIDDRFAGRKGKCKNCGNVFVIPSPGVSSVPPGLKSFGVEPAATSTPVPFAVKESIPELPASAFDPYPVGPSPSVEESNPYLIKRGNTPRLASSASGLDDEEFVAPKRAKPTGSKPRKRDTGCQNEGIPFFDGIPGKWYLYYFGLILALVVWTLIHPQSGGVMLIGTLVVALVGSLLYGGIGMLVIPFQESVACGLMNMFVPIYLLYYLVTRWGAMRGAFLSYLTAFGVLIAMAITPAVAATRNAVNRGVVGNTFAREVQKVRPLVPLNESQPNFPQGQPAPEIATGFTSPTVPPSIPVPPDFPSRGMPPRFVPPALPGIAQPPHDDPEGSGLDQEALTGGHPGFGDGRNPLRSMFALRILNA